MSIADIKLRNSNIKASYDELPYYYHVSENTHPRNLALIAELHGLAAPDPERARILELACGRGVNIASIAYTLPLSQCLGIELSSQHLKDANALKETLELENIHFEQADIMDIDSSLGKFDYIIVYGTFSWVPEVVQQKILKICSKNLSANGVALVHYAAQPGTAVQGTIRNMFNYHLQQFETAADRFEAGMEFVDFLAENSLSSSIYTQYMTQIKNATLARKQNFFHEALGEESKPFYFQEFMQLAEAEGLRYVGEADLGHLNGLTKEAQQQLAQTPDVVRREQYADFLLTRGSKATLLCHSNHRIKNIVAPPALHNLHVSAYAKLSDPESKPDLLSQVQFDYPNGRQFSCNVPIMSACMLAMIETWPESIHFDDLLNKAIKILHEEEIQTSEDSLPERQVMARELLNWSRSKHCNLSLQPVGCTTQLSDKPTANPVARFMAKLRRDNPNVNLVSLRHQNVAVDSLGIYIVQLLDGSRTENDLVDALIELHKQGVMEVKKHDEVVTDIEAIRKLLAEKVNVKLQEILACAILIS